MHQKSGQAAAFELLRSTAQQYRITVRYERYSPPPPAPLEEEPRDDPPEPSGGGSSKPRRKKKALVPLEIRKGVMTLNFSGEEGAAPPPDDGAIIGRVLLSNSCRGHNNGHRKRMPPLYHECNGVVIDATTWTPLVIPTRLLVNQGFKADAVNEVFALDDGIAGTGGFEVIQVSDGTIMSLYNWTNPLGVNRWALSTKKGYEMSNVKWIGEKSYAELVYEVFQKYGDFVAQTGASLRKERVGGDAHAWLEFTNLDPRLSYTFAFRHEETHPLLIDRPDVWNIQASLPDKFLIYKDKGLPHIPNQVIYTRAEINQMAETSGRLGVQRDPLDLATLEHINRTSLDDAVAAIKTREPVSNNPGRAGFRASPMNYGFILRRQGWEKRSATSDFLVESPLLAKLRQLAYTRPKHLVDVDEKTHTLYMSLKAFLAIKQKPVFLSLFPQYAPAFERYRTFCDNVVGVMIHRARNANTFARTTAAPIKTHETVLAEHLLMEINKNLPDFNIQTRTSSDIIRSYVYNPGLVQIYMRVMAEKINDIVPT